MSQKQPIFNNQHTPIIPWIGGKWRLAKHILPMFPEHACYVEPFCGAAALYFLKQQAKVEVLNDISEMRKAFAGLHMESLPISYTVGGGKGSKAAELVIRNW